ncbi:ferric reductase like transmembrane component-domain-containing protein [Fomitopsis serialis]|uniref:ferric reductase like transmembrane component-domain-containing protein n=1 Tax=Fomitopsis serialis TaxID=139415 RepID=UPI0020086EE3|nr:ferric reductase like transmembrane component-domain-containing protein [Neoantrodia serialis]KAH9926197.1 ferric reductase like transmembrane component-domain-containing protein [Neoantrodia serialis]
MATPSTTSLTANPTTPYFADDQEWITAYLTSMSSLKTAWLCLRSLDCLRRHCRRVRLFHLTGLRGGWFGALWSKGEPIGTLPLPSNAQILTLTFLVCATLAVSFVGPDYFAPGSNILTVHNTTTVLVAISPDYTIRKAWWTSGNRTGVIAFALFPLCVLLALKLPPFAILSLPFVLHIHFDKLAWLHKWIGRLIWFCSAMHVALWSVQLLVERRPSTGKVVYAYAWDYTNFIYGWIAFGVMTLLVFSSFRPIRRAHYEIFYGLHVLLVPLTLIFSALHHPPVWWWCWGALAVFVWWLNTNGYFDAILGPPPSKTLAHPPPENLEMARLGAPSSPHPSLYPSTPTSPALKLGADVAFARSAKLSFGASGRYVPPAGFAHAELLPGRTIRLRLITPGYLPWAPGQHFLVQCPAISRWTTHPFTNATICDQEAPNDEGRELVFLIRAKNGWTKRLWDAIATMIARGQNHAQGEKLRVNTIAPPRGVLLRTLVDGPCGSAARARWGEFSTFALSVLQYMTLCMSGRDGQYLGGKKGGWGQPGFKTKRVRFVWLVREFGHIQWCATLLRRCMTMIPAPELQVDIFVTNVKAGPKSAPALRRVPSDHDVFAPPAPRFARQTHLSPNERPESVASVDSDYESEMESFVDLSYYTGEFHEENGELGHEEHVLDLTNFEGDDDTAMPGESQFNQSVKREGRLRRAASQRAANLLKSKKKQRRDSRNDHYPPAQAQGSSVRLVDRNPSDDMSSASIQEQRRDALLPIYTDVEPASSSKSPASAHPFFSPSPLSVQSPHSTLVPNSSTSTLPGFSDSPNPNPKRSSEMSAWSEAGSLAALISEVDVPRSKSGEQIKLELDEQEVQDVGFVAEHARPGKPKLDRILADEVQQAQGAIVVGCCGPLTLNAVVRKVIAAQIDPGRIRRGDMSGSITLISEDFEY